MADKLTCTDRETDNLPDGSSDDENSEPDPRIQTELDRLNLSSSEINRLENELDEARTKYRSIVSGTTGEMEAMAKGRKKSIRKAREYYRLTTEAKLAQSEALKAARQYQTASGIYNAAKETVALAENRLVEKATTSATQLSSAWQEMLNHAIQKVTVAEKEKAKSEQDHKRRSNKFAELETRKQELEKKFSKSIKKARPYFELKSEMDVKLMQQKQNVIDLQAAIKCNKAIYNESLRKLESISEEIHQSRKEKLWARIPRMPCVGADTESITSDMSGLDIISALNTETNTEEDEENDDSGRVHEIEHEMSEEILARAIRKGIDDCKKVTCDHLPSYSDDDDDDIWSRNKSTNVYQGPFARTRPPDGGNDDTTSLVATSGEMNSANIGEIIKHTNNLSSCEESVKQSLGVPATTVIDEHNPVANVTNIQLSGDTSS